MPANTAYQIAAELINSNIHNYKQINEFRERMSNASQPNWYFYFITLQILFPFLISYDIEIYNLIDSNYAHINLSR